MSDARAAGILSVLGHARLGASHINTFSIRTAGAQRVLHLYHTLTTTLSGYYYYCTHSYHTTCMHACIYTLLLPLFMLHDILMYYRIAWKHIHQSVNTIIISHDCNISLL